MKDKEKRYRVEGSPAESELTGVVYGETESKEWTEEQDKAAMERRLKIKSQEELDEEKRKELEDRIAEWEDEPTQPG